MMTTFGKMIRRMVFYYYYYYYYCYYLDNMVHGVVVVVVDLDDTWWNTIVIYKTSWYCATMMMIVVVVVDISGWTSVQVPRWWVVDVWTMGHANGEDPPPDDVRRMWYSNWDTDDSSS